MKICKLVPDREWLIDTLANDYADYLYGLDTDELKLIVEWNVYTVNEAKKLEKVHKQKEA